LTFGVDINIIFNIKNILKLFSLITAFSLCVVENLTETGSKITISLLKGLSGDSSVHVEVPVVDGKYSVSDLMAQLYSLYGYDHKEPNKIMPHYSILDNDRMLSDDEMVSVKSQISFIQANYTKAHILVREGSGATITIFGDLDAIFKATFEDGFKNVDEYLKHIKGTFINNTGDICLDNLFLKNAHLTHFCDNISVYIDKVTTSSGQVFIKDIGRCNFPGARVHTALYLFYTILAANDSNRSITQQDLDVLNPKQPWIVDTESN
jgi:hypothetical protein